MLRSVQSAAPSVCFVCSRSNTWTGKQNAALQLELKFAGESAGSDPFIVWDVDLAGAPIENRLR